MNATDKKKAERYFVEHIQRYYPGYLPDVSPRDFEGPDFLIEQADCSLLGLEVTQLFHPRQGTAFPELQVAQFHRDIVRLAGEIHQSQHPERPVDVATYYDRDVRLRDLVTCAQRLSGYVATLDDGTTGRTPLSPEGLSVVRVCAAADPAHPKWECWSNSHTQLLTLEFLATVIAGKNALVPDYRSQADHVWLLLVSSLGSLESGFAAPAEITQWRFSFDFDRVLLLVQDPGEMHDLQRAIAEPPDQLRRAEGNLQV